MTDFTAIGAAVIGTGFVGTVHVGALRRLGVRVEGVLGSSAERGAERARALGVGRAWATLEELCDDPKVDVVHVTSPNHAHFAQVRALLAAGKHVICEKPLAMTLDESAEMVRLAEASGRLAAVCFNTRFYALNHQARGMVQGGELGDVRLVTGHYQQDWLARETDWNWRLEPDQGGALRSVGDIGTHWIDLTSFITGMRPTELLAELTTFIPKRRKPVGPVETFAAVSGETEPRRIETDDAAQVLLRYPNGATGAVTISQVSMGHKNSVLWDIAGSEASASWAAERLEQLWIGHRDVPNQVLLRDPGLMNAGGKGASSLPGGHVEGYADTFFAMFRQVYGDVAAGGRQPGATWATFEDGHFGTRFCDAVLRSAATGAWVSVEGKA